MKSMYGTQDAPNIWQTHYTEILQKAGFRRGLSNASVFYQEAWDVRVMGHGDDFLALGDAQHLEKLSQVLKDAYELKYLGILGDEDGDRTEAHFLNRFLTACPISSRSWDRYAARIVAERYFDASLLSSSGLRLSSICCSADFLISGDSTPFTFSRPNAWIKRSTCLRSASITIDPLPFFFSTRIVANRSQTCRLETSHQVLEEIP